MIRAAIIPGDGDFACLIDRAARLGFTHVEIEGMVDRPEAHREILADSGLFVASVRLGQAVVEEDLATHRQTIEAQKRKIADSARLGATTTLLSAVRVPPTARAYFLDGCELLASFARSRGMSLLVSCSASILPESFGLALDSPTLEEVRAAGARLAYLREIEESMLPDLLERGYGGILAVRLT